MTVPQAHAALKLAPRDDVASRVEPNLTRRQLVLLMESHLLSAPPTVIDLLPMFAMKVEMVAQDCLNPARIHFAYTQEGELVAGWNKDEAEQNEAKNAGLAGGAYYDAYPNYDPIIQSIQRQIQEQALRQAGLLAEQARAQGIKDMLGLAHAAQAGAPPAPPPPTPKPDPKAPGFVLKRPKL